MSGGKGWCQWGVSMVVVGWVLGSSRNWLKPVAIGAVEGGSFGIPARVNGSRQSLPYIVLSD